MNNTHKYNRNTYVAIRIALISLISCFFIAGGVAAFYSAKGVIYNPIFHWPASILNKALGKTLFPSSTVEFTRLNNIPDYYSLGDMTVGAIYILLASILTFYLFSLPCGYIAKKVNDYCLEYKLGFEGALDYKKEQREKMIIEKAKDKAVSDFESAQHEYWLQWKKFYKSDLSYEQWKERVIKK